MRKGRIKWKTPGEITCLNGLDTMEINPLRFSKGGVQGCVYEMAFRFLVLYRKLYSWFLLIPKPIHLLLTIIYLIMSIINLL